MTCGPWYDFELPRTPDIFRELDVLSSLTHLSLFRVCLDTDFLPSLLGPGNSSRTALRDLQLINCIPPTPAFEYEAVLAYLLQATVVVKDLGTYDYLDIDSVELKDKTGRRLDLEDDDAEDWDFWEQAVFRLGEEASVDFRLFRIVFDTVFGPFLTKDDSWPSRSPFTCLTSLNLQLVTVEQLNLIVFTSTFPSLRRLTLHGARPQGLVELYEHHFETMRRSITRFVFVSLFLPILSLSRFFRRTTPHEEPGAFLLPTSWDGAELFTISNNLQVPLEFGKPIPPLSPEEMKQFGEYGGPQLELLDCREAEMVLYFD